MKSTSRLVSVLGFLLLMTTVYCQSGIWTWMHGSGMNNHSGNYGVKGVTSPNNEPPSKYQAAHWKDSNGIFWMFGGVGPNGLQNDMWKFDPEINQWTWMHGPSIAYDEGEFGTKGVPSPTNVPPANGYGTSTWYDGLDGLYMYGGVSIGDGLGTNMWKFDINTNEWVWLEGDGDSEMLVQYGTKGIAAVNNNPGYRSECESTWFRNDTLWLFGGHCRKEGQLDSFTTCSDVWIFDINTNLWTWMNDPKGHSLSGVSGTLGEHSIDNHPGGRMTYTNWVTDSVIYIYSGSHDWGGIDRTDLWQYRINGNTWAWMDGSQNMVGPLWEEYCDIDIEDNPGSKWEHHTVQSENQCKDILWVFGGVQGRSSPVLKNDLWAFIPSKSLWKLVWGNPTNAEFANYGEKELPSLSNVIPAKFGACIWTDSLDNIWVFGGRNTLSTTGADMWRFEPDYSCFDCCELTVDIRLGHVSMDSTVNGTISISVIDGQGDIEYSIDGGNTWHMDNFFQDLPPGDYTVIVRDETGCIYETIVTILDFSTSIVDFKNDLEIKVFPNPTRDILYYAIGPGTVETLEVFSMTGKQIECRKAERRIELSELTAGTYFLHIESGGKSGRVLFEKL